MALHSLSCFVQSRIHLQLTVHCERDIRGAKTSLVINPEDGKCNVCQNVGKILSILFGAFTKAEVTHVRNSNLKTSSRVKGLKIWKQMSIMQGKYWV
jgi:hypothetical protein